MHIIWMCHFCWISYKDIKDDTTSSVHGYKIMPTVVMRPIITSDITISFIMNIIILCLFDVNNSMLKNKMHTIVYIFINMSTVCIFSYSSPDATRTHTQFLATDFESVLSTNSNTEPFIRDMWNFCGSWETQTLDLLIRSELFYSTELKNRFIKICST